MKQSPIALGYIHPVDVIVNIYKISIMRSGGHCQVSNGAIYRLIMRYKSLHYIQPRSIF